MGALAHLPRLAIYLIMYKHAFLVFAVAMAAASAVERAYDGYYNTIDDGGMDAYGYQMPAAAAYNSYNNYYNGHDDAELVYAPYHSDAAYNPIVRRLHKRSPGGVLINSKVAKLTALKALKLGKFAGLGGTTVFGKKMAALAAAKTLKGLAAVSLVGR